MAAISLSGPILAVLKNEQLLKEKGTCAKSQNDISKTERLVRVYTHRRNSNSPVKAQRCFGYRVISF